MSALQTTTLKLKTGYEMPVVGLGTWKSKPLEVESAVKDAIEAGYRHIDTAFAYLNEKEVGNAIKACIEKGIVKRSELFITTKLWTTYMRRDLVRDHFLQSLKNLQLDYVDLYLIHWPISRQEGGALFPENENKEPLFSDAEYWDTWAEMQKLVDDKLVRSIGLSNFNSEQIQLILDQQHKHPISVLQVESSPYSRNDKLIEFAKKKGIVVTAYSSFGSPDRPWVKPEDRVLFTEPKVLDIAKNHGKTAGQVIVRWVIQRGCIVIPKSVNKGRIIENSKVFDFELSKDDMAIMDSFEQGRLLHVSWLSKHRHYPFHIEF